jgi:hypothetical protein
MTAYDTICQRYERPDVQVFAENHFRVILRNWHVHRFASHTKLSGDGPTLDAACKKLLETADSPKTMVARGYCDWLCCREWEASEAHKLAKEEYCWRVS